MNRLVGVLGGVLVGIFLALGLGLWLFFIAVDDRLPGSPVPVQTPSPSVPDGVPKGGAVVVSFVRVHLAPHVQAVIQSSKTHSMVISIRKIDDPSGVQLLSSIRIDQPEVPLGRTIFWEKQVVERLRKLSGEKGRLGKLQVQVLVCPDRSARQCTAAAPYFAGSATVDASGVNGSDLGTIVPSVSMPPLLVTRGYGPVPLSQCYQSAKKLGGYISLSSAIRKKFSGQKIIVIGVPAGVWLGYPLQGPQARRLTSDEILELPKKGVVMSPLPVVDSERLSFSVTIPAGYEGFHFDFYALPCGQNRSPSECIAGLSPLPSDMTPMAFPDRELYRMVPKGFRSPSCGDAGVGLYLDDWSLSAPPPSPETLRASPEPELVEGIVY